MINFILPGMLGAARYPGGDERRFLMSSIMSVLQSSYSTAATPSLISPGDKFAPVNAASYQGTWTGKDYQNQPITMSITKVSGYRANVTLQTSAGLQFQRALITTKGTFRIGDSQFTLGANGSATISTIVTNATTGIQTENKATLTQSTTP
jgi:hypothetical protein